jgi:hypothetical protein
MNKNYLHSASFRILVLLLGVVTVFSFVDPGPVMGQKQPKVLKLDVDADDKTLCASNASEYCVFYGRYDKPGAVNYQRVQARNEMIQLVRGQIDTYYKLRKDGRKTKLRWLQTLLDFLEIGAATSIAIMNGERAKTVVGAALNGFQGGRTAFNKNFEVLQTQVLINKMNSNRAEIFTEILRSMSKNAEDYSWYAAKNDLRRYLFAGTFNNALDSLVEETGANVSRAERTLRVIEKGLVVGEVPRKSVDLSRLAAEALAKLDAALKSTDEPTKQKATDTLRTILLALNDDPEIKDALGRVPVSSISDGAAIRKALIDVKGAFLDEGDDALVMQINQTIVDITEKMMK